MRLEARVAKIQRDYLLTGDNWEARLVADIARAIRAERNAALEEAAKHIESDGWHSVESAAIRSLKIRAPRAKRAK